MWPVFSLLRIVQCNYTQEEREIEEGAAKPLSQKEPELEDLENSHPLCVAKNDNVCPGENTEGVSAQLLATEKRHVAYGSNRPPGRKPTKLDSRKQGRAKNKASLPTVYRQERGEKAVWLDTCYFSRKGKMTLGHCYLRGSGKQSYFLYSGGEGCLLKIPTLKSSFPVPQNVAYLETGYYRCN